MKRILGCLVLVLMLSLNSWAQTPTVFQKAAATAIPSVMRILIPSRNVIGTGFLHKSGNIITAAHVVAGANLNDIIILDINGRRLGVAAMITNSDLDLALIKITEIPKIETLKISNESNFQVGSQVSVWGFPDAYAGRAPLLIMGYIAGLENDTDKMKQGKVVPRWVINAAFNNGTSGSPLIDINNGEVIGVVSSKMAPIPPTIASALNALKNQDKGFIYTATNEKGQSVKVSEAQIVEMTLQYLRSQTQLVMGEAATINSLRVFLKSQNIEP